MGGFINDVFTGGLSGQAMDAMGKSVSAWENLKTPTIDQMQIHLQKLVDQGDLDPILAKAILQQETEYNKIKSDPRLRDAQMKALGDLQEIVDAGGLDPQAKAQLEQIKQDLGTQERGAREAIMANARARGIGGSGLELMNNLMSQQGATTRGAQGGFQTAADAAQRRMEAISGLGSLGGQIRGQDWGEAAQKAAAQDAINAFNTNTQNQFGLYNTGLQNYAQQYNLADKQRIADANVGLGNQQEMYNKGLWQKDFENQLRKTQGLSGAYGSQADFLNQQGQDARGPISGLIQGGMGLLTGGLGMIPGMSGIMGGAGMGGLGGLSGLSSLMGLASDQNLKEDIKPFDAEKMMDELTGYKFKFKGNKNENAGIMAQDLERSKEGKTAVMDTPQGKMIDVKKGTGLLFAGLANLNKRMKELEGKKNGSNS